METELAGTLERETDARRSFLRALESRLPLPLDPPRREELLAEVGVVLDAFSASTDATSVREAMAMTTLLGRRTAELGLVAIEASLVVEALSSVVAGHLSDDDSSALRGLMMEGYVEARIERERVRLEDARVRSSAPFPIGPRALGIALQGVAEPEWLGRVIELVGPALLQRDARSLLVLVHLDGELDERTAAVIATIVDAADVVGAHVTFEASAPHARILAARLEGRARIFEEDAASAFAFALSQAALPSERMRERVAEFLKRLGGRAG